MDMRKNLRMIALLAGATLLSTGAVALPLKDGTETKSETVKYKTADARSEEGAVALYQKLYEAALRVCSDSDAASAGSYMMSVDKNCLTRALDKAVSRVGSPMVTALNLQNQSGMTMAMNAMKPKEAKIDTVASR